MGDDLWNGSEFLLPREQRVSFCGRYLRAKAYPRTYREQVASARRVNYSRVRTWKCPLYYIIENNYWMENYAKSSSDIIRKTNSVVGLFFVPNISRGRKWTYNFPNTCVNCSTFTRHWMLFFVSFLSLSWSKWGIYFPFNVSKLPSALSLSLALFT